MLKKSITYILPINLLFDISLVLFEKGGVVPIIRAVLMLGLLIYFLSKYSYNNKFFSIGIVFSAYVLITCLFSEDIVRSLSITLKVVISILSFSIGFGFFNSFAKLKTLNNTILVVSVILLLNFLLSTIFGIGKDNYTNETTFLAGNLDDSWNMFTYSLLVTPLLLLQYNDHPTRKILIQLLIFTNLIVMVLSLKRIAVVGLVFGGLIYALFNFNIYKNVRALLTMFLVLLAAFPLYESLLFNRFNARADRFQQGSLEEEARYLETGYVWSEIVRFEKPLDVLFGLEGFNSVGNYGDGKFGERNLHIDYNLIVNTEGLVGLVLYFLIFIQILYLYFSVKKAKENIPEKLFKPINGLFWAFLLTQFVTSLGGQMYMTTFRMIIYIYLGAILGIMLRYSHVKQAQTITNDSV